MSKQKQKWTMEEEKALSAGVDRYGTGKWKAILSDLYFASSLANRSNIDLKDKWRNMTVSGVGSCSRERVRTPMLEGLAAANPPMSSPAPSPAVLLLEYGPTAEPSRSLVDRRADPDYEAMIFEAISSIQDPYGPDINAILSFIEQNFEVPENFRRPVTSKLRRLVLSRELEKVGNRYKIRGANVNNPNKEENAPEGSTTPFGKETPEDAARVAAYAIAKAENMEQKAIEACDEADTLAALLEESMVMLKIAEDLHEQCSRDGKVVLNP